MKIVCLLGSPREAGNSAAVARRYLAACRELGAETEEFVLNRLNYRGCQGCYACKKGRDDCVLRDDLTAVLAAVQGADLVVLATPVYYGDITAQLKGFIDRTFSYLKPDYLTNAQPSRLAPKRLLFVLTQGHPDEKLFADVYTRYENFLHWLGFKDARLIRICGIGPSTVDTPPQWAMQEAESAARAILA